MDNKLYSEPPGHPLRRFCLWLLSVFGWQPVFDGFPARKGIFVVYPHTSNRDFVWGMLFRLGYGLPVHWLAKHSLFRWPFGGLLKKLGGIPVDRRAPRGAIQALAEEFERHDVMWLGVTPEGTRSHTDHWKTGFYRIALAAGVPCGLGFIDYGRRILGIETFVTFTGDEATDMGKIAAFYADKTGRYPGRASDIRLRNSREPEPRESRRAPSGSQGP